MKTKLLVAALAAIATERNWPFFVTENGAVMNAEQLSKFKLVVWNNASGDVLGFASFGEWRGARPGYRYTVEHRLLT